MFHAEGLDTEPCPLDMGQDSAGMAIFYGIGLDNGKCDIAHQVNLKACKIRVKKHKREGESIIAEKGVPFYLISGDLSSQTKLRLGCSKDKHFV
jgi:hypothetical protein